MASTKPFLAPTSELDAVNIVLSVVGQSPINSLIGELPTDAVMALNKVREIAREVQGEGWHFNTETDWPLTRNIAGEILLSDNILRVKIDRRYCPDVDPVQRGKRLYDRLSRSYTFNKDLNAELIIFLPFEELPESARRYIVIRSARIFQDQIMGEGTTHQFTAADEAKARINLEGAENDTASFNLLDNLDTGRRESIWRFR